MQYQQHVRVYNYFLPISIPFSHKYLFYKASMFLYSLYILRFEELKEMTKKLAINFIISIHAWRVNPVLILFYKHFLEIFMKNMLGFVIALAFSSLK